MNLIFKGKSAIVTGACGGMGLEISKNLSNNQILVLMIDLKEPPKNFLKNNQNCTYKKVDVTDFNKLKKSIDIFYKKNKQIDYLVNATGVLWFNKDISSTNIDPKIWDKVYEINLKSMVYLSKIIIPKMIKNKFGSMVHISSVDALSGDDKLGRAYWWQTMEHIKSLDHSFIVCDAVKDWETLANAVGVDNRVFMQLTNIWQYEVNYLNSDGLDAQIDTYIYKLVIKDHINTYEYTGHVTLVR